MSKKDDEQLHRRQVRLVRNEVEQVLKEELGLRFVAPESFGREKNTWTFDSVTPISLSDISM